MGTRSLALLISNLLNKNFCVAQDAVDSKGFGTSTEMLMSLMLYPSINK